MQTITLSEPALALLRDCFSGAYILVDDGNRDAYRELAEAGLMTPLHTPFGRGSAYRMTQEGVDFCSGVGSSGGPRPTATSSPGSSPARARSPHRSP